MCPRGRFVGDVFPFVQTIALPVGGDPSNGFFMLQFFSKMGFDLARVVAELWTSFSGKSNKIIFS